MHVEVIDSAILHDGFRSRVRSDQVRFPDGSQGAREVIEHLDAVAIVPVHHDGTVTLLRHYRHPLTEEILEIPAGVLDVTGEDPADAARRELAEEVGLAADELTHLTTFANSPGWTDETTVVYLATGLTATAAPDGFVAEGEEAAMREERLPLGQAVEAVRGERSDAKSLIGLLLASEALRGQQAE